MNTIKKIASICKCVDCGAEDLVYSHDKLFCEKCTRSYYIEDNILSMMPSHILDLKKDEISKRDSDAQTYDAKRPNDYSFLIDYFCIENNRDRLEPDSIALDLGCGTGRASMVLAKYVKQLICIDFSLESLKIFNEKMKKEGIDNIVIIQADVNNLPFCVLDYFDFISCVDFFQHIPSFSLREKLLSDLYSILKRNGHLSFTTYNYSKKKRKYDFAVQGEKADETGKQGFHKGHIYYYNFDLSELYVLCKQQNFSVTNYRLFYFDFPLWVRGLKKIFKINRLNIENILYQTHKKNANRIYMLLRK